MYFKQQKNLVDKTIKLCTARYFRKISKKRNGNKMTIQLPT